MANRFRETSENHAFVGNESHPSIDPHDYNQATNQPNQTLNYEKCEFSEAQVGASLMQNAWMWVAAARHGRNLKHVARIWQLQHLSMHDIDFSHGHGCLLSSHVVSDPSWLFWNFFSYLFIFSPAIIVPYRSCSHWLPQNSCFKLTGISWNKTHQKWHKGSN